MKIRRILEGDRYTSPAAGGLGYVSAYAEEDGYEIDYAGTSMWLTDVALEEAMRQRLRELAIHGGGEEMSLPQLDAEPSHLIVEAMHAAAAIGGIAQFIIPGCDADTAASWQETIDALTPAPAGRAIGVPLNHEVVEVPSSEQIQAVLDRVDEIEADKARPNRCPTCDSPSPEKHPAMQFEGEVQPCSDAWHGPTRLELAQAAARFVARAQSTDGRCEHCRRPSSSCPSDFDCTRCHKCQSWIPDGTPRVFTTATRVYCLDCGKHA